MNEQLKYLDMRALIPAIICLLLLTISCAADNNPTVLQNSTEDSVSEDSASQDIVAADAASEDIKAGSDALPPDAAADIAAAPTCEDGQQNGEETGIDCGGPTCGACEAGLGCEQWRDCISGVCSPEDNRCVLAPFVSVWKTDNEGKSGARTIELPLVENGRYDFVVDWGDQNSDTVTGAHGSPGIVSHTYDAPGTYTVTITGTLEGWSFRRRPYQENDAPKLIEIKSWGPLRLGDGGGYFTNAQNMKITATDRLDLRGTTSLAYMFKDCSALDLVPSMNRWDVSGVTHMRGLFSEAENFNQNIRQWDVSGVTDMSYMFEGAKSFNRRLDIWDVSSVTTMRGMFSRAYAFNKEIGDWDVSNVTDMGAMFYGAAAFNQPIGQWDVSRVTAMWSMFDHSDYGAQNGAFNQDIGDWNVGNVTSMYRMFHHNDRFNQDIGRWDVSKVTDMRGMFLSSDAFDQNLGDWNITALKKADNMLYDATLSVPNYDALLIGWAKQQVQRDVRFSARGGRQKGSRYSSAAAPARQKLIDTYGWTISDRGQTP